MLEAFHQFLRLLDIPSITLAVMLCGGWIMVRSASEQGHYDFAKMLKDENGNESITKLGTLASLIVSSWIVMFQVMHTEKGDPTILLIYLSVWASVPVGLGLTDALKAKWTSTPVPNPTTETTK